MPTLLVHGFTQGPSSWAPLVDALLQPLAEPRALRVPDDLDFVATAAQLGELGGAGDWIGYSMGGRLSLQLALDRPDLARRLVLVSATPGIVGEEARAARRAADAEQAAAMADEGVDAFLERWLAQPLFATLSATAAGLADRRRENTVTRLAHQLTVLGQGAQPDNWSRLHELAIPVLLVVGALDAKYVAIAESMAARVDDAELHVVADAGHACHLERPDDVAHAVASWSARHPSPG